MHKRSWAPLDLTGEGMAQNPWVKDLETGYLEMDEQHEELFGLINELNATAASNPTGRWNLMVLIRDYTEFHFRWEEELMERHQFPGALAHKSAHDRKLIELENLVARHRTPVEGSVGDWMDEFRSWFAVQIEEEDKAFAAFLAAH